MRTFAKLLDHELPNDAAEDSFDISSVLFGNAVDGPIRDHLIHHSLRGTFAVRQGPWKLILGRDSGGFTGYTPPQDAPAGQLYNLAEDPGESQNRYDFEPEIVERLAALWQHYQKKGRSYTNR